MIGEKVRAIRLKKKIRQTDLAERLNMSKQALRHFENAAVFVKPEMIIPLAEALGVDPLDLLERPKSEPVATE